MKLVSAIIISILSFLMLKDFDIYPNGTYDKSLDLYRLFTPGVIFSIYLVVLHKSMFRIWKLIRFFILLLIGYFFSLFVGTITWGIAVPILGGMGALLVKWLFYNNGELLDAYHEGKLFDENGIILVCIGFLTSLLGLIFYYYSCKHFYDYKLLTEGFGFGLIIGLWQLGIGVKCIKIIGKKLSQYDNSVPKDTTTRPRL